MQLLLREELRPSDLARKLGVTSTAIRQHLATLGALGLVERRRVPAGPSRPPEVYRLSLEGRRVFPKRYDLLVAGLVDVLLEHAGPERTLDMVAAAARRVAERILLDPTEDNEGERWERLLAWLEQEFAWEADPLGANGTPGRLIIHQCPFQDVSIQNPSVCGVFFSTLIEALQRGVRVEHVPNEPGQACCAFVVRRSEK